MAYVHLRSPNHLPNIVESKLKLCPDSLSSYAIPLFSRSPAYIDTDSWLAGLDYYSRPIRKYPEWALNISEGWCGLSGKFFWLFRKLIYMSFFYMVRLRSAISWRALLSFSLRMRFSSAKKLFWLVIKLNNIQLYKESSRNYQCKSSGSFDSLKLSD